jgi:hypothetical protein
VCKCKWAGGCVCVCVCVCLSVVCLSACLSVCLPVCLSMRVCVRVRVRACTQVTARSPLNQKVFQKESVHANSRSLVHYTLNPKRKP